MEKKKNKKANTDAIYSHLGDFFQYFVALESCLEADDGDFIYIEKYGDVTDSKTQTEVKHHIDPNHILSENHSDFWKTLKNWVIAHRDLIDYQNLILLTTSNIRKNSKLYEWNAKTKEEKFAILESLRSEAPQSIEKFVNVVFGFNASYTQGVLLKILEKFRINYGQERIREKVDMIAKHPTFKVIPPKNRQKFIYVLLAKIQQYGIENQDHWVIPISEFNSYLQNCSKDYCNIRTPLPTLFKEEKAEFSDYKERHFVKEIHKINYLREIPQAINDYHRANITTIFLCDDDYLFINSFRAYLEELKRDLSFEKDNFIMDCPDEELSTRQKYSKKCYIKCMGLPHKSIKGIANNEDFFQRGAIHQIVDEHSHSWLIKEEEINEFG
jgi:hypothetical protein